MHNDIRKTLTKKHVLQFLLVHLPALICVKKLEEHCLLLVGALSSLRSPIVESDKKLAEID